MKDMAGHERWWLRPMPAGWPRDTEAWEYHCWAQAGKPRWTASSDEFIIPVVRAPAAGVNPDTRAIVHPKTAREAQAASEWRGKRTPPPAIPGRYFGHREHPTQVVLDESAARRRAPSGATAGWREGRW